MNTLSLRTFLTGGALALLLVIGAACDSLQGADDGSTTEVEDLYNVLASELSLTASQQSQLSATLALHSHGQPTPGYLWIVADSLNRTLTADQIAQLVSRTAQHEGHDAFRGLKGAPGGGGYHGLGGFWGGTKHHGVSPVDSVLNLTEEQQAALEALHETYRAQMRTLHDARRDGTLTEEDFLRQVMALSAALEADARALLTAEQGAALEAFEAAREAELAAYRAEADAVRDQVLGLTSEQSASFNTLLSDHLQAREVLVEQFQSGAVSLVAFESEVEALKATLEAALQALLSDAQYQVVQIHEALSVRLGGRGHKGPHGGPGGPQGGPGGPPHGGQQGGPGGGRH